MLVIPVSDSALSMVLVSPLETRSDCQCSMCFAFAYQPCRHWKSSQSTKGSNVGALDPVTYSAISRGPLKNARQSVLSSARSAQALCAEMALDIAISETRDCRHRMIGSKMTGIVMLELDSNSVCIILTDCYDRQVY